MEEIDKFFNEVESYRIDPEKCKSCGICAGRCPVEAISGEKKSPYVIDQEKCIRCGTCLEVCPTRFNAISRSTSALFI
ncbi:MAG: 4Fe-4S binding protein [Dehalococcoidales bacterium]|nr:4Fe-4S binding protein [Dehalococcoidales bacterium]